MSARVNRQNREAKLDRMSRRSELFRRIAEIDKAKRNMEMPYYNSGVANRARKRMERFDALPVDMRQCVNEYGLEIVQEFMNHGVRRPSTIAHLIDTVRHTDQADGNPRFKLNKGPHAKRNPIEIGDDCWSIPNRNRRSA